MFMILFSLTTRTSASAHSPFSIPHLRLLVVHFGQMIRYRTWWLLFTVVLAGSGEITGWYGRFWSSYSPLNDTPYAIQCVVLPSLP